MPGREYIVVIDADGDLILNVLVEGENLPYGRFQVSSKCLCLASPVFRAMLGPLSHFQEAEALREAPYCLVVVELKGDDYDALAIILNILHLRTRNVPNAVTADALYDIAVVCNKYDAAEAVVPWVNMWRADFTDLTGKPGYERWLLISWVFQQSAIFANVTLKLILETRLGLDGRLATAGCDDVAGVYVPDRVRNAILAKREEAITNIIGFAMDLMDKYTAAALTGNQVCISRNSRKTRQCDSIAAGELLRCLVDLGIWPTGTLGKSQSVNRIALVFNAMGSFGNEIIDSASTTTYTPQRRLGTLHTAWHGACGPTAAIVEKVAAVLGSVKGLKLFDLLSTSDMFFPEELE